VPDIRHEFGLFFAGPAVMTSMLIVEDDGSVRHLLESGARRHFDEVDTAPDGLTAATSLRQQKYDAVVLDLMLPGLNGFQLADMIKGMSPRPSLVIFSSLSTDFEDRFWSGVRLIRKPTTVGTLEAVLHEVVRRSP
jgi:two-component system OmpR family response regulator